MDGAMTGFSVRPFELSEYNVGAYIVKNPSISRYQIISEYQASILKKLESGASAAEVLFPSSGVATSKHFEQCVTLFSALKEIELVVPKVSSLAEEAGTKTFSVTKTVTLMQNVRFGQGLAEFILTLKGKFISKLPVSLIVLLPILFLIGSVLLFPNVKNLQNELRSLPWWVLWLAFYLGTCLALSTRQIFRAGFLRAIQRKITDMRFVLVGPFLSLAIDDKDIWMGGHRARLQIAIVGLLSPFYLAFLAVLLEHFQLIPNGISLTVFWSVLLAVGLSSFPFLKGDGDELLHLLMFGHKLDCSLAADGRKFLQNLLDSSRFRQRLLWLTAFTTVWTIIWVDLWSSAGKFILPKIAYDVHQTSSSTDSLVAYITYFTLCVILMFPVLFILSQVLWGFLLRRGDTQSRSKKFEIDWAEKRQRLARIPLFAALSEESRDRLLEEMENQNFARGEFLVKQGEHGDQLFVMLRGEAKAIFRDATGTTHRVGTLKDGDTFGEVALIDDVPRTASVIASKDCIALSLSKEDFEKHIATDNAESNRVKQMIRLSSFFKRHPLFSRLPAIDQAQIIEKFRFNTVVANEELNGAQVKEPRFFLIYTGKLMVTGGETDQDFVLSSEDCFGFSVPGNESPYPVPVKAFEGSGLLSLSQQEFKSLIWDKLSISMESA